MIISHKYRYIFWKPRSVGGSSVLAALGEHTGPLDHVTCPAELRSQPNHEKNIQLQLSQTGNGPRYKPVKPHLRPHVIRKLVGEAIWNEYLKVSIIRNPWDKAVSVYHRCKSRGRPEAQNGFKEFVGSFNLQDEFYWFQRGQPITDRVLRFESLQDDYDQLCRDIGVEPSKLPRLKAAYRPKTANYKPVAHYSTYYDDFSRAVVARTFPNLIETFGYEFEE